MLGYRLYRRHDVVSEAEFLRTKHVMQLAALAWVVALIVGLMMVDLTQTYSLLGIILVFMLTLPSPFELFQSYGHYKKKWLTHGGASRGERKARLI